MSEDGKVVTDQLFKGLTRPPMIFGVSYKFVMANFFLALISYIFTSDVRAFLLAIAMHGVAYVICHKEPLFIELIAVRLSKCNVCRNKMNHGGCNSYDIY